MQEKDARIDFLSKTLASEQELCAGLQKSVEATTAERTRVNHDRVMEVAKIGEKLAAAQREVKDLRQQLRACGRAIEALRAENTVLRKKVDAARSTIENSPTLQDLAARFERERE